MKRRFISMLIVISIFCMMIPMGASAATTYDPNKVVEYALAQVGKSYASGYCLRFVKECFKSCYGFTSSDCCAYTYGKKFKDSTSQTNIPVGADVFFKGCGGTCSTCGNKAGHIGIYVGNGYVVHATGGKVQKTKLTTIASWSGCSYVGWGWHGDKKFITVPSAPVISSISATGDTQIEIKWNAVSGATSYILQGRKAGEDYKDIKETSETSYTQKNLDDSSLYWYRVKAKNSTGNSGYSTPKAAYTKPKAPTTSIVDKNSIKVNWSNAGGSSNYELLARKSGDDSYKTIKSNISGNTYTHTGLEPGTQYYYRIKAHNNDDTSAVSNSSDTGFGYTKLNPPTITGKTATTISLDWSRGSMDNGFTYTYRICKKEAAASSYTTVATVSNSSYKDINLKPNTTYYYYIDVLKNGVWCINSEGITVTTNEQTATDITLSQSSISALVGQTYVLNSSITPSNTTNKTVIWTSSNTNIATVSNGMVTAKAVGTATITAKTTNGLSANCTIRVDTPENLCSHSFGEWLITKAATCTTDGEKNRTCSICGKTESEIIFATGHNYLEDWTIVSEPTCSEYGLRKHICTNCGLADETTAETIDMIEHTPSEEWIVDKEATCSETGLQHQICSVCGSNSNETEIPTAEHTFNDDYIIEQEATCQQIGIEYVECTVCGEKEYIYRDMLEHDYALIDLKDATSTEEGYATYLCNNCDSTYTDIIPIIPSEASIIVNSVKGTPGEEVNVEISIHDNPGIASAKLKISYDENVMTLKNVTDAGILGSTSHSPLYTSPYTLYWNNGSVKENFFENGTLVVLTFEISATAQKGYYPINVAFTEDDIFDVNLDVVKLDANNGELHVIDTMLGDLNYDGKITVKDNMYMSRYVAEWPDYTAETVNVSAADLNSDNKVNVKDDMILSRYIAEWPGYETLPYNN